MSQLSQQTDAPPLAPEFELMLLCARNSLNDSGRIRLEQLVTMPQLDWPLLMRLAAFHRLLLLLFRNLQLYAPRHTPPQVLQKLHQAAFNTSTRNLQLTAGLHQLLALLTTNGIQAVPFKGPVLSQAAYGDINLRRFTDLDILVAEKDALKARDVLIANGYTSEEQISPDMATAFLREENFFVLFHSSKGISIDLHWELTGRYSLVPLYLEDITDRVIMATVINRKFPTLSIEDNVIYLCIHSSSHCWDPLENVSCISELIRNAAAIDWQVLSERSTQLRCRRMVLLGLFLCRFLFNLELPLAITSAIDNDKNLYKLGKEIGRQAAQDPATKKASKLSWRFSLLHIDIRDSFSDKIKYLVRLLFRPTIKEWQTWPLPSYLTFLYYLYRPLRLGWGLIKLPTSR